MYCQSGVRSFSSFESSLISYLLLERKADVDAKDEYGETALHQAARGGHEVVVRLLLEHNAEIDSEDDNGWVVLHGTAANGHETVVRLLLEHRADIRADEMDGQRCTWRLGTGTRR